MSDKTNMRELLSRVQNKLDERAGDAFGKFTDQQFNDWIDKNAKSPEAKQKAEQMRKAAQNRQNTQPTTKTPPPSSPTKAPGATSSTTQPPKTNSAGGAAAPQSFMQKVGSGLKSAVKFGSKIAGPVGLAMTAKDAYDQGPVTPSQRKGDSQAQAGAASRFADQRTRGERMASGETAAAKAADDLRRASERDDNAKPAAAPAEKPAGAGVASRFADQRTRGERMASGETAAAKAVDDRSKADDRDTAEKASVSATKADNVKPAAAPAAKPAGTSGATMPGGTARATGFGLSGPKSTAGPVASTTPAKPAAPKPATPPPKPAAPAPRSDTTAAPTSKQMFQSYSDKGDDATSADFFAADKQKTKELRSQRTNEGTIMSSPMIEAFLKLQEKNSNGNMFEAAKKMSPKDKELAAMGHPKDKITHKDVLIGRGVLAKEESDLPARTGMERLKDKLGLAPKSKGVDPSYKPEGYSKENRAEMDKKVKEVQKEEVEFSDAELAHIAAIMEMPVAPTPSDYSGSKNGPSVRDLSDETISETKKKDPSELKTRGRKAGVKVGTYNRKDIAGVEGESEAPAETKRVAAQVRTTRSMFNDSGKEVVKLQHPETKKYHEVPVRAANEFNKDYASAQKPDHKDSIESSFVKKHMS
jgi:hypothetical protein